MFGLNPTTMVTKDDALPGRASPITVPGTHLVLATPLSGPVPEGHEVIYFAMGCFWGSERIFWQTAGVYTTAAGYLGGWTANPTYEETCTSRTGHTETVKVVYDPTQVPLDTLFAQFWENHDPTTPNRQGGDVGTQYRSAIFTTTPAQQQAALASREAYQAQLSGNGFGTISTQIDLAADAGDGQFYYAEEYHQGYLFVNPSGYCNHGFCQVAYTKADA